MTSAVHVFDRLLEIALLIQQDMTKAFHGTALTAARVHLLWELQRLGPSTQQTLAAALGVTPRNVTGLVDALEPAGYLERRPHPTDRRATLVTLTPTGAETMAQMATERGQIAADLVTDLPPDRLAAFGADLDTVAARLQAMVAAADQDPR